MEDRDRAWGWENCPDIERHRPADEEPTVPGQKTAETSAESPELNVSGSEQVEAGTETSGERQAPQEQQPKAKPVYVKDPSGFGDAPKREKWFPLKLSLAIISFVVIIGGVCVWTYIDAVYDVTLSSTAGGLDIRLTEKDSYSIGNGGYYGGEEFVEVSPGLSYAETDESLTTYPAGDGTTLEVTAAPSEGGNYYSLQEIYQKCIDSIVLVNVSLTEGEGIGTGVIMSENGYIVTNAHVVEDASRITIELDDGQSFDAALVGRDEQTDLAVLKIDATGLTPAEFGDSAALQVGDGVAAIGNPLGQTFSLSNGIISALDRDVEVNGYSITLIQTNVAINEGNSGGALINMYGQVIGITNMKFVSTYSYSTVEGMAFAIPTSIVQPVVNEILANGYVTGRPSIGIQCSTLDETTASYYGLPQGVYINSVYEQSNAYGKLYEGDVILEANGQTVTANDELSDIKNQLTVGDVLSLQVYRDGETVIVDVMLVDSNVLG